MSTTLEANTTEGPLGPHPVRLRLTTRPGADRLGGGWWPRSLDPLAELSTLLPHVAPPADSGTRLVHAALTWDDWEHPDPLADPAAETTLEAGVRIGWAPDERHVVVLTFSDATSLRLLVVPPDFTRGQGAEALLAAATAGNEHSAADLLDEVTDQVDVDPWDHWSDDGGA